MDRRSRFTMLFVATLAAALALATLWSIAGAQPPSTQVCMAIDGSGSVDPGDFTLMLEGIASAIEDNACLPQDGSVELTVVQFSDTAVVEVGPVTITSGNVATIAADIRAISQLRSTTDMAAAFTACEDAIVNSPNFATATFQVINLSTDGVPNDEGEAIAARDSAIAAGIDEIDAEAIGDAADVEWLRDSIVWPQPGHEVSVDGYIPGWVHAPADYTEFAEGICTKFQMIIETEDMADLAVIKMSKPDTQVHAGEPFVYTIFVENLGPNTAFDVGIRDEIVLETGSTLEILSVEPEDPELDSCEVVPANWGYTIECTKGEPLSAQGVDLEGRWTVQVTLVADETQDVNNLVTVFSSVLDPDLSNNIAEDFIYVTDVADLSVDKYLDWCDGPDDQCVAGARVQFSVDVANNGPSTAENVVVEDLVPSGVTVDDVFGDGGCTTGIPGAPFAPLTCNLGSIPSGERRSFSVVLQIDPDYVDAELPFDSRLLENNAWVYSDIFDPDNSNNRDYEMIDVYTFSGLAITKWGFPDVAGVGDDVEYEIRIWNFGPSTADTIQFADLLPPTVDYKDYYIEQGTGNCVYHDPLSHPWWDEYRGVHCYVDEIPPNGVVMVHLLGTYNENLWWAESREDVCNIIPDDDPFSGWDDEWGINDPWFQSGWWADSFITILWENSPIPGEPEYLGWCPDELYVEADLAITKTSEPMKLYPGEQKVYHIEVTNNGPTGAAEVVVTDTLPISVTYEIDNGDCDLIAQGPDMLECHLGNMMPGETKAFDVWALVSRDAPPGEITNEAHVVMGGEVGGYDPNEENNWAYATNLVLEPTVADLSLEKWWGEAPPGAFGEEWAYGPEDCYLYDEGLNLYGLRAGCPLSYTLLISNSGPLLAENVVVEDFLPAGVVVENVGAQQGSCTTGIPGDPEAPLTCNLGNVPPGEDRQINIIAVSDFDLTWGHLENDAVVSSDIPDPDDANNRAHVLTWHEPFSYLSLEKFGPSDIMAGEQIEYWVKFGNNGPSTARDVYLDDSLPGGVNLVSADVMIGGGSCAPGSALCSLGDMGPWELKVVRVRGYVEPWMGEGTVITNTVNAWANSPWLFSAVTNTVTTTVHSAADLAIWKTADPYKVFAGEQVRYDITVANNGPSAAHNVVVTDTLDPGVEYEIDTDSCQLVYSEAVTPTVFGSTQPAWGGELFTVDLGTGAGSFVGYMPEYLAAEIEFDNLSNRLFASMGFAPWYWEGGYPLLYELNPDTGTPLGYVELEEQCSLPGLEFVDGTLYGTCSYNQGAGPDLYTIDPDTGDMGYVGDTYLDDMVHGLAYDESSGTMYGLVVEYPNQLVTIDLDDGEAHYLCDIWDVDDGDFENGLRALEFGPDGTLYGGTAGDSDLVIIDPNPQPDNGNYCNMTHVGDTGFSITGLTLAELREPIGVECSLGDIPPGETRGFSIWARVKPDTLGMINNRVDVVSETGDPNPDNNWDSEANLVLGKADLKVTKYGKPDGQVRAGDELEYWVVVDNLGPGYAHDVVLYDLLSSDGEFDLWWGGDGDRDDGDGDGMEYSCRASGCDYCVGNSCEQCYRDARLTCRLNDPLPVMTPDAQGRWLLKVWVRAYEDQSINNLARVIGRDYDPDLSNNEAIAEHDITAVADLELDKYAYGEVVVGCEGETEMWENEVAAGGMLQYRLDIENEGPSEAENVVVEDWGLSPYLDIVDVWCDKDDDDGEDQCSCNLSGLGELGDTNRHLVCYFGSLYDNDEAEVVIMARIPSDVPEGTRLVNDARVYSDVFDDNNGNNLDSNWTYVGRWADLAVEKTQAPEIALPGWDITYTITVTNLGLSDVEGLFVSDTLPVQVLNPTWTCCASDGSCDCPCEVPVCPPGECPWPDIGLYAQADIPAGEWVIYTVEGTLDTWPCGPFTNTVELIPPMSLLHPDLSIDPCPENNVAEAVNDPFCHFDPLVLKAYPGPDSPP